MKALILNGARQGEDATCSVQDEVVADHVREALARAAEALADGRPVPDHAITRAENPPVPAGLYRFLGSRTFKRAARGHGVLRQLHARPCET